MELVAELGLVDDARLARTAVARVAVCDRRALGRGGAGAGVAGTRVVDGGNLAGGASRRRYPAGHLRAVTRKAGDTSSGDAGRCGARQLPGVALALDANQSAGRSGCAGRNRGAIAAIVDQLAVAGGRALWTSRGRAARATTSSGAASRCATLARATGGAAAAASTGDADRASAPAVAGRPNRARRAASAASARDADRAGAATAAARRCRVATASCDGTAGARDATAGTRAAAGTCHAAAGARVPGGAGSRAAGRSCRHRTTTSGSSVTVAEGTRTARRQEEGQRREAGRSDVHARHCSQARNPRAHRRTKLAILARP